LTQRQLAEKTGVPQSTVGRIEAGTTMPRVDTFERLLEACGMDIELTHKRGVGVDTTLIEDMLELTPQERLERVAADSENVRKAWGDGRLQTPA